LETFEPMIHEDSFPGHESVLDPHPDWTPRYPGSGRLEGKVALIAGCDSGIGRAVAALYAREGADVAIVAPFEHDDAQQTLKIVMIEGRRAIVIAGDLGNETFCEQAAAQTVESLGRLDILVNYAGEPHPDEPARGIDGARLLGTAQAEIRGMALMAQAARPHLGPGTAIINCTAATHHGSGALPDDEAKEGAITAFTHSLSEALVADGIRVNAVAPGPLWTPPNAFRAPGGDSPKGDEVTPMGRPGQPNEVAPAFLFLACEDSSYMSGQILRPNGGTIVSG